MSENKLRGIILSKYRSMSDFSRELGWSRQKTSSIVSFDREPRLSDIQNMANHLDMDVSNLATFLTGFYKIGWSA